MFGGVGSRAQTLRAFQQRFDSTDGGYLFRAKPTAAPVKISNDEYQTTVDCFSRQVRWLTWGGGALFLTVFLLVVGTQIWLDDDPPDLEIFAFVGVFVLAFLAGWIRIWTAPNRAFEYKPVAGSERSRQEARTIAIKRMSWQQLGGTGLFAIWGIWRLSRDIHLSGRWTLLLPALAILIALVFGYRAFTKWRIDRGS